MIIFRAYFICLVAIIPVFAALHVVDQPNHLLTRRDANSDLVNISTYVDQNLKIPKLLRVAKDLREDVKSDLKQFFSTKNLLSIAQKFIKIALKLIETLTGYVTSESVREAIQLLGFPGAESVAKFVELILQFVNELIKEISESDFIVGEPTTENFVKMLSDSVLLSLKKGLYLNAVIMESAKKAFAESNNVKYDVLDNIELSSQLAKEGFDIVHKYAKQIIQGIEKLTNNETMEIVTSFVKNTSLPCAQEFSEILGAFMAQVNGIAMDLGSSKFITEAPSMKNVNKFIVLTLKTIVLKSLEGHDKILKIILAAVQKARGETVDVGIGEIPELNVQEGIAIQGINNLLNYLVNIDSNQVLNLIHNFVAVSSKFVLDITNDPGVSAVPDIIRAIGNHLTDACSNIASFLIDNSHRLALIASESKFVKEEKPSWENGAEFLHSLIKESLKLAIEDTRKMKTHFDSSIAEDNKVPNIVTDILRAVISDSELNYIQSNVKKIAKALKALSGPIPSNAIRGFIHASKLPFAPELADVAQKIMGWVNELARISVDSKFLTETATAENAAIAITEIFNTGVSTGLKLISDILEIVESLF